MTTAAPASAPGNTPLATHPSADLVDYLLRRRSTPIKSLSLPGPGPAAIQTLLQAAARVPDHGRLFPWHFIVFAGESRKKVGALLKKSWLTEEPDAAPAKLELEAERFLRAPLVIAVISRFREGKHPLWEQILSAGAACQNLCIAAHALGFGTNWVTEWYAYNKTFREGIGLDERDHVAGFIYIGTPAEAPAERDRPDLSAITTYWEPECTLNKGAAYGQPGMGLPRTGFSIEKKD